MQTTDIPKADSSSSPSSRKERPKATLLCEEAPLLVLPSLAQAVGLNEAIVLQQLHYLLSSPANGRSFHGRQWIYNTLSEWIGTYFPFWCERTLRAIFQNLEAKGYVLTCQPEGKVSRRKYYTLNDEALGSVLEAADLAASNRQTLRDGKRQTLRDGKRQTLRDGKRQSSPDGNRQTLPDGNRQMLRDGKRQGLPDGKRQSLPLPSTETTAETSAKNSSETSKQRIYKKESAFPRGTFLERTREMVPDADCGPCGNAVDFIKIILDEGEIGRAKSTSSQGSPASTSAGANAVTASAKAAMPGKPTAPVVYARPTAQEWARFMRARHPDLAVNPGWDWCQSFHAECHTWLQEARTEKQGPAPQSEGNNAGEAR